MGLVGHVAILARALGLPWFIEGLEGEDVNAPGCQTANGRLPISLSTVDAWNSSLVFRTVSRPSYAFVSTEIR